MNQRMIYLLAAIAALIGFILILVMREQPQSHLSAEDAAALEIRYCGNTEVCAEPSVQGTEVWCVSNPECKESLTDTCGCNLYRDRRGDRGRNWEQIGNQDERKPYDSVNYNYACWCTAL